MRRFMLAVLVVAFMAVSVGSSPARPPMQVAKWCPTAECVQRDRAERRHARAVRRAQWKLPCVVGSCPWVKRRWWRRERAELGPVMRARLRRLRACETRGFAFPANYRAATGNGFYGSYQWTVRTWGAAGGKVRPDTAIPAEQDVRTGRWIARYGSANDWPVCGR